MVGNAEKDPAPSAAEAGSAADIMAQLRSATADVKQQQLNVFVQSLTARDEESEEGRVPQAPSFPVNVDPNLVAVLSGVHMGLRSASSQPLAWFSFQCVYKQRHKGENQHVTQDWQCARCQSLELSHVMQHL